jgi:hypothetical protein
MRKSEAGGGRLAAALEQTASADSSARAERVAQQSWRGKMTGLGGRMAACTATVMGLVACHDPLDILGVQEVVTEEDDQEDPLADDRLEDKHPEYDPRRTVQEEFDGCLVTLNKSASVTRLSIAALQGEDASLDGRVFASRGKAVAELGDRATLPSMEVVNGALKPFNDGLYAAVELGADDGSDGGLIDERQLFRDLLAELVARTEQGAPAEATHCGEAAAQLAAAIQLGGETPTAPASVAEAAGALVQQFDVDTVVSRPIGFYTWSAELEASFRRDRFLQGRHAAAPGFGAFVATALVLGDNAYLRERYQQMLDLYAGLTNPFHDYPPHELIPYVPDAAALGSVDDIQQVFFSDHPPEYRSDYPSCSAGFAFLPASDSPENRLMRKLLCQGGAPPEGNLIDHLISQIQSGTLDLAPTDDSGWYDRQLYALETLLLPDRGPESAHLLLTREYKEKLVETFKSILIQTRETHVRQLETPMATAGSAPVVYVDFDIYPKLVVEPFPTFYLRTARAYRFVDGLLRTVMGEAFLEAASRVNEDGTRGALSLSEELRQKTLLLYGLHAVAADSIGMAHGLSAEETAEFPLDDARQSARDWLPRWGEDADVNVDPRVIVPVAIDEDPVTREEVVAYWGVVGVKVLRMHASFPQSRRPEVVSVDTPYCIHRGWVQYEPYMLVEATVEVKRPRSLPPLTRDEFRALCDEHDEVEAIARALESG